MLRQAAWSRPDLSPSHLFRTFEHANLGLGLNAAGTAILARLQPAASGSWSLTWTNAGHPPPVLLQPGCPAELLDDHDILFGFAAAAAQPRTDHRRVLAPGSSLFLYTDGLVERRGTDLDTGVAALLRHLEGVRTRSPRELVDSSVDTLVTDSTDDVVAFALTLS
jgi:serine phosphatase RsbU (regulator of sigma subunit)